jgi:hypothetical protein
MRPLLLALLLTGVTGFVLARRVRVSADAALPGAASSAAPAGAGPELALVWNQPAAAGHGGIWPGRFRVVHRRGGPSGPVQLTFRTPVGLAHTTTLVSELPPGAEVEGELALRLGPGMTELCLEVRSSPVRSGPRERDLTDNRICRRTDPIDRASSRSLAPDQETRR